MQWQPISRRSFLKIAAVTAVGVSATFYGHRFMSAPRNALHVTPYGNFLVLEESHAHTLHAFAEAVLPRGGKYPTPQQAQVLQRLDEELYFISQPIAKDVKLVLDVLEWMPVMYAKFGRFSRLSLEQRLNFLNGTKNTRSKTVRAVINNCRMLCFNMYYGHESSWSAIGYDGPFAKHLPEQLSEQRQLYAALTTPQQEQSQ